MFGKIRELINYHELMFTLAWKNVAVRYKQAYLGVALAVLKPTLLMIIFTLVRSFVGIETGDIPYPILTFAALMPWVFFQEATSESIVSVVSNSVLIRKIYFPREILPLTAVATKLFELGINFFILAGLMLFYQITPSVHIVCVPLIIAYIIFVSLSISLTGAAMNVYYRDISTLLPVGLNLLMYASPVIYPLSLVQEKLLVEQFAGGWSTFFYKIYIINPIVGVVDSFQKVMLVGGWPDFSVILPGFVFSVILFPLSYWFFKRGEAYFADII